MDFKKAEQKKQEDLIAGNFFEKDKGGGIFMGKARPFVLKKAEKNLYKDIAKSTVEYFKSNGISWWRGKKPTGHTLSSQIACLNHLFLIKNDHDAVFAILKGIRSDFVDVLPIPYDDEKDRGFIGFEVVSHNDYLNEGEPTRGANCTSVDAFIYAVDKSAKKWLIPIEWKFTEFYNNADKSTEDRKGEPKGTNGKGKERMDRYNVLINNSVQLKTLAKYQGSVYFQEPFYQLMRQTLWAEQVIKNKDIDAEDFLHIHVVPSDNKSLLEKKYKVSGMGMESTWTDKLNDKSKYIIIDPEELLKPIVEDNDLSDKYSDLIEYLGIRYWHKAEKKDNE